MQALRWLLTLNIFHDVAHYLTQQMLIDSWRWKFEFRMMFPCWKVLMKYFTLFLSAEEIFQRSFSSCYFFTGSI